MPKEDALPLLLEAISWKKSFPIIGISANKRIEYYRELEALALIDKAESTDFRLTNFGESVLRHTGDLRSNIVQEICKRCHLPWHGCIASGYMGAQCDCFLIRPLSSTCGLYPGQLAVAHHAGSLPAPTGDVRQASTQHDRTHGAADSSVATRALDCAQTANASQPPFRLVELHTAIKEYFTAAVENRLPNLDIFWDRCFAAIDKHVVRERKNGYLGNLTPDRAAKLLAEPN